MKRRRKILNRILGLSTAASLMAGVVSDALPGAEVRAADKQKTVTYEYYTTVLGKQIPASWLYVGTCLMSAKSLSAEIYQAALDSREYYEQPIAYYSSELDGGCWKNVEGASSITTILPIAEKVAEEDLYPYLVTMVVGDDGIPRDPVTEEPIDIYTSVSLYDMENIKELKPVYDFYLNGGLSWENEGSENYLYRMLYFFFENDDLDFDRASLDAGNALLQYKDLSTDRKELERIWETALTKSPDQWPAEYVDLMQVMRNWPNIRDDVTDRADREEELLGALFLSLQSQELSEEADSALYVERQIDAARRARIYYNLTMNENLTGSYGMGVNNELETLELDLAELKARIAQLALDIDKAEMPVKQARSAIYELEDSNESEEQAIAEEEARWTERAAEDELDKLNGELDIIQAEFAPVDAEYQRLNKELDDIYNESIDLDSQQKAASDEIDALKKEKEDKKAEYDEKIKEAEDELSEMRARSAKAEARRGECEDAKEAAASLQDSIDRLEATITAENDKLDTLAAEADSYTSSRTTAGSDSGKIYDPAKKQDADRKVSKQQKLIDTLMNSLAAADAKLLETKALIDEIEADLDLADTIAAMEVSLEETKAALLKILDEELMSIDVEISVKQEELAAMSDPYQEKLLKLKAANDAYIAYLDTYKAKKTELDDKKAQIASVEAECAEHDELIRKHEDRIAANNEQIKTKELIVKNDQIPVDALNEEYEVYAKERDVLEDLIEKVKQNVISPYAALIKAENLKIEELSSRVKLYKEMKTSFELASAELENEKKQTDALLAAANKKRDEDLPAQYDEKKAGIESTYNDLISEAEKVREKTAEEMRNDLLELEKLANENDDVAAKSLALEKANEELKLARELESAVARYFRFKADLDSFNAQYDRKLKEQAELQRRYDDANFFAKLIYKRDLEDLNYEVRRLSTNIGLAKQYMDTAESDKDRLKALCPDFKPAANDDTTVKEYVNIKQLAYDEISGELRDLKNELDNTYDTAKKRWEKELAACDSKVADLKKEKEDQLYLAGTSHAADMERARREIENITADLNEVSIKISSLKLDDLENDKNIQAALDEIEEHRNMISVYQERERSIKEAENFGVAPTLKFLEDASVSGKPDMGRRYEDIAAYAGKGGFEGIGELSDRIQDAFKACEASYDSYTKKSMQRGDTAAEYAGYILSRRVAALAADEGAVMPYLQMLTDLRNIEAGLMVHDTREMAFLYTWLLPFAINDFNVKRNTDSMDDYHRYLVEVTDRDTPENGVIYIEDRLEYAKSLKNSFTNDGKKDLIESHIAFLEGLLQALRSRISGDDGDKDVGDYEQTLLDEQQRALEEDDLVRAKMIGVLLDGLEGEHEFEEDEVPGGNTGKDEFGLNNGEPPELPDPQSDIIQVVLDELNSDDYDIDKDLYKLTGFPGGIGDLATALDDDGEGGKFDKDIARVIANSPEGTDIFGTGGSSISGGTGDGGKGDGDGSGSGEGNTGGDGNIGDGNNTGDGSGDGADGSDSGGKGGGSGSGRDGGDGNRQPGGGEGYDDGVSDLDAGKVKDKIDPMLQNAGDDDKAAIVAALAEAAQYSGNDDLNAYAKELLDELLRDANSHIYRQYMGDKTREYVSLAAMDKCRVQSGYRYVRRGVDVTMSQLYSGSASYTFTIGQKSVKKNNGEEGGLEASCAEQTDKYIRNDSSTKYAYIPEDDSFFYMGCDCIYIRTTDWAILLTPGMDKRIKEIAEILNEMADRGDLK